MSNSTQRAPSGQATYRASDDADTGLALPSANVAQLLAGGVAQVSATATGVKLGTGNGVEMTSSNRLRKIAKVSLAAASAVFSWTNPEADAIAVCGLFLDVTTQTGGACTVDVGTTATTSSTSSDNLIDGLSVAAAGLFSNYDDAGSNGKKDQRLASGKWVTGTVASGTVTGLVGSVYIEYFVL